MDEQLMRLLAYQDVLGAIVSTFDGLPVAVAGVEGEDAEVVAAAGTALLRSATVANGRSLSIQVDDGQVHVLRGDEVVLVVVSEAEVPHDALVGPMDEVLRAISASIG
jgi:predicted regulator of Ras-like GTPase activity (Roadblock/LC7/MglB family)